MSEAPAGSGWRARVANFGAWSETLGMVAASCLTAAVVVDSWERSLEGETAFEGVQVFGTSVGGEERSGIAAATQEAGERQLDRELELVVGDKRLRTSARELGALPVYEPVVDQALAVGRSGDLLADLRARELARRGAIDLGGAMRFDESRALERLMGIAPDVDSPSLPTRMDFDARQVLAASRGTTLLPYDSLSNVAIGLASGDDEIDLAVAHKPPIESDPLAELDGLDISARLSTFSTPYSMDAKVADRTHNLEVGAAALDGLVLGPGERFSFNAVVGPRDAESGYRYAPGISGGQIVDVFGGGICQIASSLYGAAFFAGLEVERQRPHSRPSGYVDMGLDATVVYDTVDLKLRNDYDFPVVFHVSVNQGRVTAEILGARRPYQVAFEREITEVVPFAEVWRDDPTMMSGYTETAQRGMRGFKVVRKRVFYEAGDEVRAEQWELNYPPTTHIVRRGSNPAGRVPDKKKKPPLRDPAPQLRVVQ